MPYSPFGLRVQDHGGSVSLDTYMRLPVEQYHELDPTMIRPLGGRRFALTVPRIHVSTEPPELSSNLCLCDTVLSCSWTDYW